MIYQCPLVVVDEKSPHDIHFRNNIATSIRDPTKPVSRDEIVYLNILLSLCTLTRAARLIIGLFTEDDSNVLVAPWPYAFSRGYNGM